MSKDGTEEVVTFYCLWSWKIYFPGKVRFHGSVYYSTTSTTSRNAIPFPLSNHYYDLMPFRYVLFA